MRKTALEFTAKGKVGVCDLGQPPELEPTQILLETQYSGVTNGTERHALLSEHGFGGGRFPSRHGYQHVGKVVAAGGDVARYQTGDWVFYGAYVGHNGWNVVNEDGLLIKLPVRMDHKYCALFGVAGVALRSVRRMGVGQGDNVWVAGQGPIGHFVAQTAKAAGARVTVTDMLEKRLDVARRCGAHVVLNVADKSTGKLLEEGGLYDYIYDCCSAEALLFDVHKDKLLARGGTIAMMAVRDRVNYPWGLLHGTEGRIETSCHFDTDDLRVLLFLCEQGLVTIEPMVSHVVSIDQAPEVYNMLADSTEGLLGVIFDWTEDGHSPSMLI
ncbi:MAG TPA: zinc-binding dehydrogenase [Phycisphaerae bacterium]|nr:zinc-binding dehydrogenase [Phycisphaerae bacterium]